MTTLVEGISEMKRKLISAILLNLKANNVYVTGEMWFGIVFLDEIQLKKLAHEMHIRVDLL